MVLSENIHTINLYRLYLGVYIYICAYMHVTTVIEERGHGFERARESIREGLKEGKEREE